MQNETNTEAQAIVMHTNKDMLAAVFIVSVLLNVAVLVAWLVINVDPTISVAITKG